jgi:hypothetical protein
MHNFLRLYDGYINGISAPNRNEQNNLTKNKLCNIQTQFDLAKNKLCNTQIDTGKCGGRPLLQKFVYAPLTRFLVHYVSYFTKHND